MSKSKPCIICVAITGSVPTKDNNPNIPISITEQVESTQEAFEAGAAIVHCHVRDEDGRPTSDPDRFAKLKDGIEKHCPGIIIQFSTGGRSGLGRERGGMLHIGPEMASLAVGSNNFPSRVYENPPDLVDWLARQMLELNVRPEIEAFDLSHIHQAAGMYQEGLIKHAPYIQFVMGVKNAMPADRDVFEYYVKTVERLIPGAEWCGAGIGKFQRVVNEWCVELGGHTRTGMEDNIRVSKEKLASSNAALVEIATELCFQYGRPVASWQQAREILNIPLKT